MPRMKMNIAALSLEITKATHSEIQLFPAGEFSAVDGRPHTDEVESGKWVLTAELAALVAQVAARTTPFVIDYEHQTLRAVNNGKPARRRAGSARWNGVKARACMPPVWSGRITRRP